MPIARRNSKRFSTRGRYYERGNRLSSSQLNIVILGLSITSSWGNGHATTYRGLVRELDARGHRVSFLERNVPWYASHRDLPQPPYGRTILYTSLQDLQDRFTRTVRDADLVIVGSYVPEGVAVGEWVIKTARGITSFYDIDTPITLAKLERGDQEYITRSLIPRYQLYLSFTGGPILQRLEREYGSPMARPLYCSLDPTVHYPLDCEPKWDLGFMGTFCPDRQPSLDAFLIEPARRWPAGRMVVAGSLYPPEIEWPGNVDRIDHLPPAKHSSFFGSQRFTLNITRADMIRAGYSPSVRLFEAAACATAIITDYWTGLETVFQVDREIVVARSTQDALHLIREMPDSERRKMGERARARVMAEHTSAHRAAELETIVYELLDGKPSPPPVPVTVQGRSAMRVP
jgi:spore maturation protein CgeB